MMYPCQKVTRIAFDTYKVSIGDNFYIGRPTGLNQFGSQNSDRTVLCGKGLIKLGHGTAD